MAKSSVPNEISLRPKALKAAIMACYRAKQPAMIVSSPGMGKSAIMAQVAKELNIGLIDLRLSIRDSVDLRGVPFVKDGKTYWAVPTEFPTSGSGILFLDEITAARPDVQVVAYQLVWDRAVGEYKLPDGWVVMAAGNKEDDGAVVYKMSSALNSRFVHLKLQDSIDDWIDWALSADIEPTIIGLLKMRPELFHQFEKDKDTGRHPETYTCSRTWELVSKIIKVMDPDSEFDIEYALIAGAIGKGAAGEFLAFLKLFRELPTVESIILNPTTAKVPTNPSCLVAVGLALARKTTVGNFAAVKMYLDRLADEYSVLAMKDAQFRCPELAWSKEFLQWAHKHGDILVGLAAA